LAIDGSIFEETTAIYSILSQLFSRTKAAYQRTAGATDSEGKQHSESFGGTEKSVATSAGSVADFSIT
jgi:hypothetical protein